MLADQIPAVLRHHPAVFFVILAAPVEVVDFKREAAITFGDRGQRLQTSGYDFRTNTVAWDRRY